MKTNIALIGFMGTGKTVVGQALAKKLNRRFVETDALIEQQSGKSIPDIFQQDGEITFRELEIAVTKEVAAGKDQVIACGGGLVLNQINIDRLKKDGVMVYLTAPPQTIHKRTLADQNKRPLLKTPDKETRIRQLLQFRRPFYERAADIAINTSRLDVDSVAEQIMDKLKENEGSN